MKASTIVALATPQGIGALAVIRLSGPEAFGIAAKHFKQAVRPREVQLGMFSQASKPLDQVLMTSFKGPHSFTGEDVIEWTFHGSHFIIEQALAALLNSGATLAQPGEFTQRAFMHGKLDLTQAEAVGDLIASESYASHELAMRQLKGSISNKLQDLRQQMIDFAALIELELDFGEEDVEFANREKLAALLLEIQQVVANMLSTFKQGQAIREGIPMIIAGAPNAGKSTLLNRLVNDDRAIVSDIPGTTRDSIEVKFRLGQHMFRLIDTAGIRASDDAIEQMGVERSWANIQQAQVILFLVDPIDSSIDEVKTMRDRMRDLNPDSTLLTILTKRDKWANKQNIKHQSDISIGMDLKDLKVLERHLQDLMTSQMPEIGQILIANTRHAEALKSSLGALKRAEDNLNQGTSGELLAFDLREALDHIGSITGEVMADDSLGSIFSRFCIGK
ncbi:MAG: tRNA uridine-5-carboxymethylaminomethyl(34) synthesis GTPase MnmE [Bacteroidetes bacterium]|nr:tRNA uridine-5-carboxymethylaminomethyl(34) synthesis GTPase MnmE [Bacteroidota bacterium]